MSWLRVLCRGFRLQRSIQSTNNPIVFCIVLLQLGILEEKDIPLAFTLDITPFTNRFLCPRGHLCQGLSVAVIRNESMSVVQSADDEGSCWCVVAVVFHGVGLELA